MQLHKDQKRISLWLKASIWNDIFLLGKGSLKKKKISVSVSESVSGKW